MVAVLDVLRALPLGGDRRVDDRGGRRWRGGRESRAGGPQYPGPGVVAVAGLDAKGHCSSLPFLLIP